MIEVLREDEDRATPYYARLRCIAVDHDDPPVPLVDRHVPEALARAELRATAWARVEDWIAWRYEPRAVTWTVRGAGEFVPRLTPALLVKAERWSADDWSEFTPDQTGPGVVLVGGDYRLRYAVGGRVPPPAVLAAVDRLVAYLQEMQTAPGLSSVKDGDYAATFRASAMARALQDSGAADLLRSYR